MDCPVCETTNIEESIKICPTCGYDISPYPLVLGQIPVAFIEKEQQRIAWAKKLWADCQAKIADNTQTQFQDQLNPILSSIQQLSQNQITAAQLLKADIDIEARFSELEKRLRVIIASECDRHTEKILEELKQSLSRDMSSAVSQSEKPDNSMTTVSSTSEAATPYPSVSDIGIPLKTFSFTTVEVNDQGQIINRKNLQARYFSENLGNSITLDMVYIPGGEFVMGYNEKPPRRLTVPSFLMGKYPVTQGEWEAVMGNNPSEFQGGNLPVEKVSWNDAVAFCQKLSQKTGKIYRLPSEAEWEYACRAGTMTPFYFGETITTDLANYQGSLKHSDRVFIDEQRRLDDEARRLGKMREIFSSPQAHYGNGPTGYSRNRTTGVGGSFPPNAFGLFDMHGNVQEWCADTWHDNYHTAPIDGSAWTSGGDPNIRVVRGGSWNDYPQYCRSAYRGTVGSQEQYNYVGFRIVLSLPITA